MAPLSVMMIFIVFHQPKVGQVCICQAGQYSTAVDHPSKPCHAIVDQYWDQYRIMHIGSAMLSLSVTPHGHHAIDQYCTTPAR